MVDIEDNTLVPLLSCTEIKDKLGIGLPITVHISVVVVLLLTFFSDVNLTFGVPSIMFKKEHGHLLTV